MAEHDRFSDLGELARVGEEYAQPLPPSQVRARGTQRRHRRHAMIAAAVAVVGLATGGALFSGTGLGTNQRPDPPVAARPTAVPAPTASTPAVRTLENSDLLATEDVPLGANYEKVVVTAPDDGRSITEISACQNGSPADLGARQALARNFRQDSSDSPAGREPELYTLTLQFDDAAGVAAARTTYTQWLRTCTGRLDNRGYRTLGSELRSIPIDAGAAQGSAYELIYIEPGASEENGTFENVGLLPVEDRLVIMVRVVRGMDDNAYYFGSKPVEGLQKHPFYAMMAAAAKKLA